MKRERKHYEIKAANATLDDNYIKGDASVMGVMDRGGDVIFPGAFKKALPGFRSNGFIAVGHDWKSLPVALPTLAEERGNALYSEAKWHSTQSAQDARTVTKERLEAGMSVGLSIGFLMDWDNDQPCCIYFESGSKLLDFAKANGYDMNLFDTKGIKAASYFCRGILRVDELLEWSVVPVPMNQFAGATDAKGIDSESPIDLASIKTERDLEKALRDAGFSRKMATAITLHGFKALQRDAGQSDEPAATAKSVDALSQRTVALRADTLRGSIPA